MTGDLSKNESLGVPVAKGKKERVEQGLQEYKRLLLTRKGVDCEQSGKKMPKPIYSHVV